MGELVSLAARRRQRAPGAAPAPWRGPASFCFDLASPYTYLAAERVDRLFTEVRWVPVVAEALLAGPPLPDPVTAARARARAEARADALRMPLVWPERLPVSSRRMMRVAAHAVAQGRGAEFVLAAGRLTFCGGFDLNDPEILAEASAAAGLGLDACLRAAADATRDGPMEDAARRLLAKGADCLPALRLGRLLFCGEDRLPEAVAAARGRAVTWCAADPGAPSAG